MKISKCKATGVPAYPSIVSNNTENNLREVDMQTNKQPEGDVVVTKTEEGYIVCVTRQDEEGRVISVIAEGKIPREREDTKLIEKMIKALKSCREDMSGTRFKSKTYDDILVNAALKLARKRLEEI